MITDSRFPCPPKVFGVGMPRTGGQSLQKALLQLGFSPVGHDPANFFDLGDMQACAELRWPVSVLEMVAPGSKYIFTVRDREAWIDSIERIQPFRKPDWNPFWEQLETYMPETLWLQRHRELKTIPPARVLYYDLREGWEPLCKFLDKPVPKGQLPNVDLLRNVGR